MNVSGPVKEIRDTDYFLDTTGNDKGKKLRWTHIYCFDKTGHLLEETELDEKGDTFKNTLYHYDSTGLLREETGRTGSGTDATISTIKYSYDSAGNNTHIATTVEIISDHGESHNVTKTEQVNSFDKDKQLTRQLSISPTEDGQADTTVTLNTYNKKHLNVFRITNSGYGTCKTTYTYDDEGRSILEQSDSVEPGRPAKIARRYDAGGNLTEETSYDINKVLRTHKIIEYLKPDKQKNWTERRIHWHDLGTTITERVVKYY